MHALLRLLLVLAFGACSPVFGQGTLPLRTLEDGSKLEQFYPPGYTPKKANDTTGLRGPDGKMRIDFGTYSQIDPLGGTLFRVWKRKGPGQYDQAPIGLFDVARGREVLPCGPYWFLEKVEGSNLYVTGGGKYDRLANGPEFRGVWDIGAIREVHPCTSKRVVVYPGKVIMAVDAQRRTAVYGLDGREPEPRRYSHAFLGTDQPAIEVRESQGLNDRWGFLDLSGKAITPVHYTAAGSFHDGFAVVQREGKFTFIDPSGREIVAPKYLFLTPFTDGIAAFATRGSFDGGQFQGSEWGFVTNKGEELGALRASALPNTSYLVIREGRVTMQHAGRWLEFDPRLPLETALAAALPARLEPAQAAGLDERQRATAPWGYRVIAGPIVIPPQWDHVEAFTDGFGIVGRKVKPDRDAPRGAAPPTLLGVIDANGREALPLHYEVLRALDGPLFIFAERAPDGKAFRYGIIDAVTRLAVLPPRLDDIRDRRGRLLVAKQGDGYGLMTFQGEFIVPPVYTHIGYFHEGLLVVKNKQHAHWIDTDFKPVMADRKFVSVDDFVRGVAIAATRWDQWEQPAGRLRIDRDGNTVGTLEDYRGKIVVTPVHANQSQRCPACNGSGGRFRDVQESSSTYIGNMPGAKTDFATVYWKRAERIGNCFTCGGRGR